MIKLVRCDDRLIHGQCVLRIIPRFEITDIIVVEDYTASNAMLKKIFMMAAPKNVSTVVVSTNESFDLIRKALTDSTSTLVLMKTPEVMDRLIAAIPEMPKELNIASLPSTPGKVMIATGIYFNDSQMASVKKMASEGVHIYMRLLPDGEKAEWEDIKNKF